MRWLILGLCLLSAGLLFPGTETRAADASASRQYIVVLTDDAARYADAASGDPRPSVAELAAEMQAQYGIEQPGFVYEHALRGFSAGMTAAQASKVATDPRVASIEADAAVTAADLSSTTRSGTSTAAAHVAGAAALYRGQNPAQTPAEVASALIAQATLNRVTNAGPGSPNRLLYTGFLGSAVSEVAATWGLDRIDQRDLPLSGSYTYSPTGSGVDAFIIDTGLQPSLAEFGGRAEFGFDCTGLGAGDGNGHGTHMAATVGGASSGVAKAVHMYAVRVLDNDGEGTLACVIRGIDWVAGRPDDRPRVATLSMNGPFSQALNDAVDGAQGRGVFIAVAAGNNNENACNSSPASASLGFTVGATRIDDSRWSRSNFGTCLDMFAPGANLASTVAYPALDHFKCYVVLGPPHFTPHQVAIEDQFESADVTVQRPWSVCNPVNKNAEGVPDPTTHLTCFVISDGPDQPPLASPDVTVDNQFGLQRLRVTGAQGVCAASRFNGVGATSGPGDFTCYAVRPSGWVARKVMLVDEFESAQTVVGMPLRLCVPASVPKQPYSLGVVDPSGYLMCYGISNVGVPSAQWFRPRGIDAENRFGTQRLLALMRETLCVPSKVTPGDSR